MQAIPRELTQNNWITMLFLVGFILLFFMKLYKPSRFLGYSISFFTRGFIEKRAEEKPAIFSTFHVLIFSFCALTLSLFVYTLIPDNQTKNNLISYVYVILFTFIYLIIRRLIDYSFSKLFDLSNYLRYFIFTKVGYLYTLSIWLFPILIAYNYGYKNNYFLWGSFLILIAIRFGLVFYNNKKLIIKHLFYFILYLCALEIAPLFIILKILK
ncbi:DUF4271 domain-containing protein [Tenacibaculum aquimarinum]|uniref:DUF4271 domain-containing protein n=1 Tax=Tenacibaculum aquimarinum TaxID=2910675 RepID=UPI0035A835CA